MEEENSLDPFSPISLIQQYLYENNFEETLKQFEKESNHVYDRNLVEFGGQLETILNGYRESMLVKEMNSIEVNEKSFADELLKKGDGTYVKTMKTSFQQHSGNVLALSFNYQDPGVVASAGSDRRINLYDYVHNRILSQYDPHKGAILSLDFNPNPELSHLLLSSSMDGGHAVIDTKNQRVLQIFADHRKYVVCVRWNQDGKLFATASYDHFVSLYKLISSLEEENPFVLVQQFPFSANVEAIVFSGNETLVISVRGDNYLHSIDLTTMNKTKFNMNANHDDHVSFNAMDLSLSPLNNDYLLVSTDKNRMILYRMGNSTPVRNFWGAPNDTYSTPRNCFHRSGRYVYSTAQDNKVYCWDVSNQNVVHKLEGHRGTVRDICHHPTENLLGTCSFDKTVKIWGNC